MITNELRGSARPSLREALGWVGFRVDDLYGANVGRLEDIWVDPRDGTPRWILIREARRFGGRHTLIPFEDATAGAGHVWVPYEREVIHSAPEVHANQELDTELARDLREHFAGAGHVPARA
jgi:sporulation protein YlmC with PRC-barrel domain